MIESVERKPTMPTYNLTYNSTLTEDFIHTDYILASATTPNSIAAFLNSSNQSEALVIHAAEGDTVGGEVCHLQREPLSSSGWNVIGIGAQVETIMAADSGTVWITDADQTIWMSNAGHWNQIQNLNGGRQELAIDTNGTVYATVENGDTFTQYTYDPVAGQFSSPTPVNYQTPPVGTNPNNLWVIDGGVVYNNNTPPMYGWEPFEADIPDGGNPQQLFCSTDGAIWVLTDKGNVYTPDSDGVDYDQVQTPAVIASFAPLNSNLFYALTGTGSNATLYVCDGTGNNTVMAQPTGRPLSGISVGLDGTLWGLDVTGVVWRYASGAWIRQIQPTDLSGTTGGLNVTEVVTGRHAMGSQYAFYIANGILRWSVFQEQEGVFGGYWTTDTLVYSDGIQNLGVVNDPANGNLIVYGVTPGGDFVIVQNSGGDNWTATAHTMKQKLPTDSQVIFNTYNGGWVVYAIINNVLFTGAGSLSNVSPDPSAIKGSPQLSTLIPFSTNPQGIETSLLAAIDPQGQLWAINLATDTFTEYNFTQLTGAAVGSAIGSVQGAVGMIATETSGARIYARDVDDTLWVIRQNGDAAGNYPKQPPQFSWTEFHPLGNDVAVLATGCTMAPPNVSAPPVDLFSIDSGNRVNVLSEDPTSGALTDLVMLKPAGTNTEPEYVTRYATELTVTDENSMPQPGVQISITSNEAIGIWVGREMYPVTPDQAVQLTTNQSGQITFAFFAQDLNTPVFYFSNPNLPGQPTIYPATNVNLYLKGVANALPGHPQFDAAGTALSAATMQTAPDWTSNSSQSFVPSTSSGNAAAAANAIVSSYSITPPYNGGPGQWSVAGSTTGALGSSSFWGDLCKFGHDIMHAIKKAVMTVETIAVDVEKGVLTVTLALANGMKQLMNLVINTFEDIVSAVKTAFRFIERSVDEAIHWLKALFAWGDIVNTKRVLKAGLNGMMNQMSKNLTDSSSPYYAKTIFNTYWDDNVKDKVKAAFNNISSIFAQGKSLSTISGGAPLPANSPVGQSGLYPNGASDAQTNNGTQTNYVHNHVTNYANNGGTFPQSQGNSDLSTLYSNINQNLVQNNDFQPMETVKSLQSIFQNPKSFADVAMYDIITAMEDAVLAILDVIEAVVDTLIDLAGAALTSFQDVLNKTIDIPVISWIYKQISGDPLSLLDLICLIGAVPTTIVYKLLFGKAPLSQADAENTENTYNNNFPWPALAGGSSAMTLAAAAGTGVSTVASSSGSFPFGGAGILMLLNTGVYAIFDVLTDLWAYTAAKNPANPTDPITTVFSWISIVTTMIGQWLTAPFDIFALQSTTAEKMTISLWSLNFIPLITGLVFTVGAPVKALAKFNETFGLPLTCATGVLLFAMGVATSVEQSEDSTDKYNALYWVQNGIAPVPTALKPLTIVTKTMGEPAGAVAAGILMGCDAVMDIANGGLAFAEDAL